MIAANPVVEAFAMFVAAAMPIEVGTVQRTGEVQLESELSVYHGEVKSW